MPTFSIQNFGCRVNQAEAFSWAEEFEHGGMRLEEDPTRADLVVVNTCTLTAGADRDVRKFIRRVSRLNPGADLVIAGCSVDGGALRKEDLTPRVLLLPNAEKARLPARVVSIKKHVPVPAARPLRSRALLKVQDGCNLRCTFCIIPAVRGPSRSFEREEIMVRARLLIARGFREIVLCGIHLSSYGLDRQPADSLAGLLRDLLGLDGMGRLRLSSLDPRRLDDELSDLITTEPSICPHFHLSLQHASDRVLRLMGRGSSSAGYRQILDRLRAGSPEAALGADVIVGFPGEEEKDFDELCDFVARSPLDYLHVFSYSPRPGTPAAVRAQVGPAEKRRRSRRLRAMAEDRRRAFRERFLGRELDGIVVRKGVSGSEVLTANYIDVHLPSCSHEPGEEVRVKITRVEPNVSAGKEVA
jgi:threonylcarbamoyladenosine tRNA methylthiotransferase MtaB